MSQGNLKPRMLITGASRGIGKACADYFADRYQVVTVSRSGKATEIGDLTNIAFLQRVISKYPIVDVLINNVGGGRDTFYETNMINYMVPAILMEHYVQTMDGGHIINISSNVAYGAEAYEQGYPAMPHRRIWYCASKQALSFLSNALSRACAKISITCLEPGKVLTREREDKPTIDLDAIPKAIDWILSQNYQSKRQADRLLTTEASDDWQA